MRKTLTLALAIILGASSYGQSKEEKEIIEEGAKLYKTEMASWYGTDLFLAKFIDRQQNIGGYFSYLDGNKAVCIFFSRDNNPKIIGTFAFDSTYNTSTAIADGQERKPSEKENELMTIRQIALTEFRSDTLFKTYKDMSPNFIPMSDENGKRVYILTGPQKSGVVVFGNDYLLTFSKDNKLLNKRRLHKNIIPIEYGNQGDKQVLATMHSHLPETGDLITATDICTLKLYSKYAQWGQHYVMSKNNVSIWDCKKEALIVMTMDAWNKIANHQKEKKK